MPVWRLTKRSCCSRNLHQRYAEKSVIVLAGEVSLEGDAPDYVTIARKVAAEIGYTSHDIGMDATDPSRDVLVM